MILVVSWFVQNGSTFDTSCLSLLFPLVLGCCRLFRFFFGGVFLCLKLFSFVFDRFRMFEVVLGRFISCLDLFLVAVRVSRLFQMVLSC